MIPWVPLGIAPVPGGGELRLMRRGSEYSIMIGGTELMNSRLSGSEEALATIAAERIGPRKAARVLIGGLGMGFTLRAALANLAPEASVTVAELVPGVVDWARGPMADVFGETLTDPRVAIAVEDVAETIGRARGAYDAILLDVDNGPGGLTRSGNDRLYGPAGLAVSLQALTPGGILGIWSQGADPAFTARLGRAGFQVEEMRVKAGRGRGTKHVLWFATKADRQPEPRSAKIPKLGAPKTGGA
ncbi:spermidine synthase [Aureimonas sp. AU20]|uniref:spermidine synthase n=1 Tax=Aureimonas sp. AU20 TaxID=1349819 RepID=UPI000722757E|nr:spermidine synthase [Aureimonas sp. AU20]ALN71884.1 hypothetical protein M673_04090 [Aureimonas sp. AU20]